MVMGAGPRAASVTLVGIGRVPGFRRPRGLPASVTLRWQGEERGEGGNKCRAARDYGRDQSIGHGSAICLRVAPITFADDPTRGEIEEDKQPNLEQLPLGAPAWSSRDRNGRRREREVGRARARARDYPLINPLARPSHLAIVETERY